jgi:putative hydroxymethylpyrimidine transport system substrate-binding protein
MTRLALGLVAGAILLAGCGEKEDTLGPERKTELSVMLDFFPNADHAGIYAAQAGGHFDDAGLKVDIRQPPDPASPIKQVAAGRVDLAVSYEPELLRARDQGLKVISIGALVREPLSSIISLPAAKIRTPKDLAGKEVGYAGIDYQQAYLRTILLNAGVDPSSVKVRDVGFSLSPALLTKKVDAVIGAFWNYEGTDLRLRKRRPQIIKVNEAGVPTYDELVLVANESALKRDDQRLRAFIGALARGTKDLERDPGAAIKGLLDANPDLDPKLQREVVKVTLPLFLPPEGKPFGYQDPKERAAFAAWARENKLVTKIADATGTFTNDLLPGAGL